MTSLAFEKFTKGELADLAYFEPYYLKDFMVTQPKKK
jgi:tRNA threonylcarbamoyladenosine biosynthesis protein TsaB